MIRSQIRAFRVAGIYALFGFLWITISDHLMGILISDSSAMSRFSMYKGWVFITVTALLVFYLTRRALREQEHLTEILQINEAKFRSYVERAPHAVLVTDRQGIFVDHNAAALDLLGYEPDSLGKMQVSDIFPVEDRDLAMSTFSALLADGNVEGEYRVKRKDGESIWISLRGVKVTDDRFMSFCQDITKRRESEGELERYRLLAESSRDIILFICRDDGRIVEANRAASETYGYTHEELLGMTASSLRLADDRAEMAEQMKRADEAGILFETRHVRKDGSLIPVEISSRGTTLKGERILLCVIRDVTGRKEAEKALQENEERYRLLFDLESDAIVVIDVKSMSNLDVNKAAEDMYGYTREELLKLTAPDLSAEPEETETRVHHDQGHVHIPLRWHRKKDGTIFPVDITARFFTFRGRQLLIAAMRDITERRRAEEAILASEEKYRLVVENASEAIFIVQDETIKFPNRQTCLLSGYDDAEIAGNPFSIFLHDSDKERIADVYRSTLQGQNIADRHSFRVMKRSGEVLWVEGSAVPIAWEGRPAVLTFLRDITIQKKLEEQLFNAQKMEAIGTLAGGVAHDFNNLLMGILGYTSLMLMKTDTSHPSYQKLKTIERLVESGADLTRQLLGFARGGKYEVKPVNINDLIVKTAEIFGRTKKEITIHKKLWEELYTTEADMGQIEQVLLNLYVNAWQAMPAGGRLFIETENVFLGEREVRPYDLKAGPFIKITVKDTGVGMTPETQKRIFEPFFSTKGVGKGTGLGLASAYGIIKNHGGMINVHSEKGHGTTFSIYLPASDTKAPATRPLESSPHRGFETILI
ncbi:MAG TPA: PAS domain S-box protein, partial [Thermodesulfovibrionales bacterium]|nr:PAS domain S-box protein [Thermodesulfovibrionales bacterium]